jgi:hypothetical protein
LNQLLASSRSELPQHKLPLPARLFWDHLASGSLTVSLHLPLHRTFASMCEGRCRGGRGGKVLCWWQAERELNSGNKGLVLNRR